MTRYATGRPVDRRDHRPSAHPLSRRVPARAMRSARVSKNRPRTTVMDAAEGGACLAARVGGVLELLGSREARRDHSAWPDFWPEGFVPPNLHGASGPRCACRPSRWPWPPAIAQGCSWLPSMCLAWAITPRAPSADRLCASERREQKTRWHSLKPPGQYGCSAVKSGQAAAWLPSHCPRFMPCTRCAQTNRPLSVRRQCLAFLRQPELSAPVGGRAPGLRSEGSWLAAELMRAGLEPGVLDRFRIEPPSTLLPFHSPGLAG